MSDPDRERLREQLLSATLPHIPFDGWTMVAFHAGMRDAGADPGLAANAFPGGMTEMIEYWNRLADRRMLESLAAIDLDSMKVRERVARAVRLRLEQAAAHREAVRRGVAFLALPQNGPLAARCLYRTVDAIWHAIGDRSTDHNFYTKRALLAGVCGATVLFWLNDRSPDAAATWAFLDRRIEDVMRIPKAMARVERLAERLPNPFRLFRRPFVRR